MFRKIFLGACFFLVLKELAICILDKVFHMTLPLAVLFVLCMWYGMKYKQEEYASYNYISISCALLWGCLAVAWAGFSPKYFESRELISGAIGYVLVETFDQDIAFISNGRDGVHANANDVYLVDKGDGKEELLEYYRKTVSSKVECIQKGNSLFYYVPGMEDEEVTGVVINEKKGYDILVAYATKNFKHKNIFGGYYYPKSIYPKN